jgi:hypothetical protein
MIIRRINVRMDTVKKMITGVIKHIRDAVEVMKIILKLIRDAVKVRV